MESLVFPVSRVLSFHGFRRERMKQTGGGRVTNFTFDKLRFQVSKEYEDDQINLFFSSIIGSDTFECAYIIVVRDLDGLANAIVGNERYGSYLQDVHKTPSVSGHTIMDAILYYVRKIKTKYSIQYVQLRDNSSIYIHPRGNKEIRPVRVYLADYYTLTRGSTYYSKSSSNPFVPFDPNTYKIDKIGVMWLKKNKHIIQKAKLKHCKSIARYARNRNPNDALGDVAKDLFRSNPEVINSILGEIYDEMRLHRFVGTSWYILL